MTTKKKKPVIDLETCWLELKVRNIPSESNIRVYETAILHWRNFLQSIGKPGLTMAQTDLKTLVNFTLWLRSVKKTIAGKAKKQSSEPLGASTVKLYVEKLAALYAYAYREEYIEQNPFARYDMSRTERVVKLSAEMLDRKISKSDLERIENHRFETPREERMRLIFLWQRWSGWAWRDLRTQDVKKCLKLDGNERKSVIYNRKKTGELAIVPLFPQAEEILQKLDYNVNPGSYTTYYTAMKRLFSSFGLEPESPTHAGRHVFGSEMLEMGFSMEAVSRMMGHSSTDVTESIYAKINSEKIFSDLNRIQKTA